MKQFYNTIKTLILLCALFCTTGTIWAQQYVGSTWYSLYDGTVRANSGVVTNDVPCTVFPPTNGEIKIDWKKNSKWYGFDLWVGGTSNSNKIAYSNVYANEHLSYEEAKGTVGENITSVNVYFHCTVNKGGSIKDIRIPMKKHILLQTADGSKVADNLTKDFTKVPWGTTKELPVNFRSFLTNGNITITIEGDSKNEFSFSSSSTTHELTSSKEGKTYKVGANMCASANGSESVCATGKLGKISNYDFKIYFRPQKGNVGTKYSDKSVYVKITDGTSTAYVYLQGENDKRNQTIQSFSTTAETHNTTDAITTFTAYATDNVNNAKNNLPITYSSNNTNIATVGQSSGVVTLMGGGTVTLTATQAGNTYYYSTSKSVTYTVNKVTPTIANQPTVGTVPYLNNLSTCSIANDGLATVTWQGTPNTKVDGTFAWTTPTPRVEKAPGSQEYSMTFTPTDGNRFNSVTFNRSLTVTAIDQSIEMNNGSVYVKVTTGIDANAENSSLNLTSLIDSQTEDPVDSSRDGEVSFAVISAKNNNANVSSTNITNGVFTATECDTYTIRATKAAMSYYNVQTDEFTVEVKKRLNSLTTVASCDKYIEDVIETVATNINSNVQVQTSSSANDIARYIVAQNKIVIPNENAASFNDTTVTIRIWQDANAQFEAGSKEIVVTVKKYDNNISITGFVDANGHTIQTDWYNNLLYVNTSNTDTVTNKIYYEQIRGDLTMASFDRNLAAGIPEGTWVVYTGQNTGVVEWRLWQNESYKYKYGEQTFMVNVVTDPNCTCNLIDWNWPDKKSSPIVSKVGPEKNGFVDFGGVGETLSFRLERNGAAGNAMQYKLWTNNSWSEYYEAMDNVVIGEDFAQKIGPVSLGDLTHHTTAVQFEKGSNVWSYHTDDPYINNIVVTRKRWLKLTKEKKDATVLHRVDEEIHRRLQGAAATSYTFHVNFSTCDTLVKIASDDPHIYFENNKDKDTIAIHRLDTLRKGFMDTVKVTFYYFSEDIEKKDIKITVFNKYENDTLIVPVETFGYVFEGTTDDQWSEATNWNVNLVPNEKNDVIIKKAAVINSEMAVRGMEINPEASVTINPTGGLTVGKNGIRGASKDKLILKAGTEGATKGQTGYLRISPDYKGAMPEATVELYSIGYYDRAANEENIAAWQYIGAPIASNGVLAKTFFTRSWVYSYLEESDEWVNQLKKLEMQPFVGYATTQTRDVNGMLVSFNGQLQSNQGVVSVPLSYTDAEHGHNIVANSFTAPIDLTKFEKEDFVNVDLTVYVFNTGSRKDAMTKNGSSENPGQYMPITLGNADDLKKAFSTPIMIAPMQGFCVRATGAGAQVKFDYSKLVWEADYSKGGPAPLHIEGRKQSMEEDDELNSLRVTLNADGLCDHLYLLGADKYDKAYENGYDARKMTEGLFNVFALEGDCILAIDATNSIAGTQIGLRTGDAMEYTFNFSHLNSDTDLALVDNASQEVINISEGTEYTFATEPNSYIIGRFQIIAQEKAIEVTTAFNKVEKNDDNVKKFIQNNQLYILKDGVLYNAVGAKVR